MLCGATAGTGLMHESVFTYNAQQFSRKWFAWANSLFAYMVYKTCIACGNREELAWKM